MADTSSSPAPHPPVVAVIPARGGSKGIPLKNLAPLGGRPLVAWSIAAALGCARIDRVIVSTDDEEIADCAREHGAEVPFLRPASMSGDKALVGQAVSHALKRLRDDGYRPAAAVVLYPTHPFRPASLMDDLTARLIAGHRTVLTAHPLPQDAGRYIDPATESFLPPMQPPALRTLGLYEGRFLGTAPRGSWMHVVEDEVLRMDIDTPADLALAREIVRLGMHPGAGSAS